MAHPRTIPVPAAMQLIAGWRARRSEPVRCPACGAGPLTIADHSARPYAEWYSIACSACGLSQTLHIPLGAPTQGLD